MLDIENYLNNFFKGTRKHSLNSITYFMNEYNNFYKKMKFIHVAGTNGKGSCVEIISNILIKNGYSVGKFISPHLIRYNERISINNTEISDKEMMSLIEELKPKISVYNSVSEENLSLFELETIMALLYFYRNNVDFVVLETGLGGLYDATNIVNPLVSVITSIGYDHVHILGSTLSEIANQKAGIIKENSNTVFFSQNSEVDKVIIDTCKRKNNRLHLLSKNDITNYNFDSNYQYFDFKDFKQVPIILKGTKQIQNAAICIECMNVLNNLGYKIKKEAIIDGLKSVVHKARIETLSKNPLIIYDGAHNESAIKNLQSVINTYYKNYKKIYVVSVLKRKDYNKMLQLLFQDKNAEFIFTSGNDINRYASSRELFDAALQYKTTQEISMKTLDDAIKYIMKYGTNTINFIVGSFYVYGDVKKEVGKF